MEGNPSVTVFRHNGRDQIYAFIHAGHQIRVCFWNADPAVTSWQWGDLGNPSQKIIYGSPTAITSIQNPNAPEHYMHIFVEGQNSLYERSWDGNQWVDWADRGTPVWNIGIAVDPGAVTFRGHYGSGEDALYDAADRLFVFVWGSDSQLYRYDWGYHDWVTEHRFPNNAHLASAPVVINHNSYAVHVYAVGNDGRLYVYANHTPDARQWAWHDLGQPSNSTTVTWLLKPGLVSFKGRIYAFINGSDSHLWQHYWDGWQQQDAGTWNDLGRPTTGGHDVIAVPGAGNKDVRGAPAVVTFKYENKDRIYAFVGASDGHLHQCYWNGVDRWLWNDLGEP